MTEVETCNLKMWQPVQTPGGPGLVQAWVITRDGERRLMVSHRRELGGKRRVELANYLIGDVQLLREAR